MFKKWRMYGVLLLSDVIRTKTKMYENFKLLGFGDNLFLNRLAGETGNINWIFIFKYFKTEKQSKTFISLLYFYKLILILGNTLYRSCFFCYLLWFHLFSSKKSFNLHWNLQQITKNIDMENFILLSFFRFSSYYIWVF